MPAALLNSSWICHDEGDAGEHDEPEGAVDF